MVANKKRRTPYAELPQEIKDKRNQARRELDSNLGEVARARHNECRRLAYAKKANIYPEVRKSKKAKCNKCCVATTQIIRAKNLKVIVEKIPSGMVATDQNSMQTSMVLAAEKVASSVPRAKFNVECNERHRLQHIDSAGVSIDIPISDKDKFNDCYEQLSLNKKRTCPKRSQVICILEPCKDTCAKKVYTVAVARSANRIDSEVGIEQAAVRTIPTDEDYIHSSVVGVLRNISQTSVRCSATSINEIGEL